LEDLRQEYVLVQAWKKAHDYVRAHNWYADVLDLDLSNVRLPATVQNIQKELQNPETLCPHDARLVMAPKSTAWEVGAQGWRPKKGERQRLRPLAHLSIRDQTIATAFLMCVADIVETAQGNPEWDFVKCREKGMVSYGHRLMVDGADDLLSYRWGNAVYYRGYYQDYQSFIRRPDEIIKHVFGRSQNWAILSTDLSQFYDRVRPIWLFSKLESLCHGYATPEFLEAFRSFFCWKWHKNDVQSARRYAKSTDPVIEDFDELALPQGLAASGFFANVFLYDFDRAVLGCCSEHNGQKWHIVDYCRYVDDLRLVLRLSDGTRLSPQDLVGEVTDYLKPIAKTTAPGAELNEGKTKILFGRSVTSRTVVLTDAMKDIQNRVSGTLDLAGGKETLEMIEGLLANEPEPSPLAEDIKDRDPFFEVFHDVKDETIARFSANRFRRTFRLARQLAPASVPEHVRAYALTQDDLDNRAAYFAQRLIWKWMRDPSNVRLLRVSLDLFPNPEAAKHIVEVLKPHLEGQSRKAVRKVAEYCAAELFMAATTELGLRVDESQRPAASNPDETQRIFSDLATYVIKERSRFSWYLVQQALLLLAVTGRNEALQYRGTSLPEWRHYLQLHQTIIGELPFSEPSQAVQFVAVGSRFARDNDEFLKTIAGILRNKADRMFDEDAFVRILIEEDADLAEQLWRALDSNQKKRWGSAFAFCGSVANEKLADDKKAASYTVAQIAQSKMNPFRQEYMALRFLEKLLVSREVMAAPVLSPWHVNIKAKWEELQADRFLDAKFDVSANVMPTVVPVGIYDLPEWLAPGEHWRYRCGQLLRALVVGNWDYTSRGGLTKERINDSFHYTPYLSHWYRRQYGLFNERSGLGPDWLPLSGWLGALLSRLLEWPGFTLSDDETGLGQQFTEKAVLRVVRKRIEYLKKLYGNASGTSVVPVSFSVNSLRSERGKISTPGRLLRVAVAQSVLPLTKTISDDATLSRLDNRKDLQRHLAATLAAVHTMLLLRESYNSLDGRLDLVVLPELSVHIDDVKPLLMPFVRQHRCIVFAGLTYHQPDGLTSCSLVNSGIWLLPADSSTGGLQVVRVEQGKKYLAPAEEDLKRRGVDLIGWRPCQFLFKLDDPREPKRKPWILTGSICYDATDLQLASDLKNLTDTWVISAKNRDVGLFDSMVAALHYHMYQHVVLCNSGEFGGSTVQAPYDDRNLRTIVHHHGNGQVAVSFFELDLSTYARARQRRKRKSGRETAQKELRAPPAAYVRHG
jgi:hypothetical protein